MSQSNPQVLPEQLAATCVADGTQLWRKFHELCAETAIFFGKFDKGLYLCTDMTRAKLNKKELQSRLMSFMSSRPGEYFALKEIFSSLRLTAHPVKMLCVDIITEYLDQGRLTYNSDKKISISDNKPSKEAKPSREARTSRKSRTSKSSREKSPSKPLDDNIVMHDILKEFGLPYSYPKSVSKYAEQIKPEVTSADLAGREDFRNTLTFTIDPHDAKDFDDALSFKILSSPKTHGSESTAIYEVGVHIADVSHFVLEGSPIDQEAEERGTSIYLVDRTIPMLPEHLCNFVCSLRPDEEKLTFSVVFDIDDNANVLRSRIVHTVIKSNHRFAYEEVDKVLEGDNEGVSPDLVQALTTLDSLAQRLLKARLKDGAIEFNSEEMRFDVDEKGHPIGVYFHTSTPATSLIEEFMLLANRTVAETVGKAKPAKTLPYRIHDLPDPDKLGNLAQIVGRFNFSLNTEGSKKAVAKSLNKLLKDVKGDKMESLVDNIALRAMQKAKYSTYNIGHYGLAFQYYTHFTSPIRRYPDLMVHRLLTRYLQGFDSASRRKYEGLCEHASVMEQLATSAERASVKYKMVEFLGDHIGEEYDATICGVTEYGIYSKIHDNHCEGFTHCRFLGQEPFNYDEKNFCLTGRDSHHKFQMGDEVRIRISKINLERRTVDFDFIKKYQT